MDDAFNKNQQKDYLSFAADQRALDNIPDYPSPVSGENNTVIAQLSQAKNFLYLINPDNRYASPQDIVNAIKSTNYDVLIMDLFFNTKPYTAQQLIGYSSTIKKQPENRLFATPAWPDSKHPGRPRI